MLLDLAGQRKHIRQNIRRRHFHQYGRFAMSQAMKSGCLIQNFTHTFGIAGLLFGLFQRRLYLLVADEFVSIF
jgi:hypothetical protein